MQNKYTAWQSYVSSLSKCNLLLTKTKDNEKKTTNSLNSSPILLACLRSDSKTQLQIPF